MLAFALGTGIISYSLFILGVLGLYNKPVMSFVGICAISFYVVLLKKYKAIFFIRNGLYSIINSSSFIVRLCFLFLISILLVNLIVAFAPERGFDALWYHLVIPQVFIQEGALFYIPGGLLYYSAMPKLIDLLYILPLSFDLGFVTRIMSYIFGVMTLFVTYNLARNFVNRKLAFLSLVLLTSNLVFSWQMSTAYIDMARTFFELLAIATIFGWMKTKNNTLFIESALCMGLATATKVLSFATVIPMLLFLALYFIYFEKSVKFRPLILYAVLVLLVVLPWWLFAWVNTGNPFYPFFSSIYSIGIDVSLLNPINFFLSIWNVFTASPDPVSPLYLIIVPIGMYIFKKFKKNEKLFVLYGLALLILWYFLPNTGGGRFILPALPVLSVCFFIIFQYITSRFLQRFVFVTLIFIALTTFVSRLVVAGKVIPVVFGFETEREYLTKTLNFSFGDFYDTDGKLGEILTEQDVVLVYGVHNLYYADFTYIHESWVKKGDVFNYILTQNSDPPEDFYFFKKIYSNNLTGVALYYGGGFWEY